MNILTAERDAVWESIKGYDRLKGEGIDATLFRRVFRWQSDGAEVRFDKSIPPPMVLQPAISIRSVPGGEDVWEQHRGKKLVHRIEVKVWTPYHNQDLAAEIWKNIRRAVHQVPKADRTYLRDASGSGVFRISFPSMDLVATDTEIQQTESGQIFRTLGSPCTETTFTIDVPHEDNPLQDND